MFAISIFFDRFRAAMDRVKIKRGIVIAQRKSSRAISR
jgi:hypothetical protein